MRQGSPDIIMLGELREPVATSEALRAAINGHLIVTTIHTPGIIEAIERMRALSQAREGDAKGVLNLLAGGISGIIHQSLSPEGLKMQSLFISPNDKGIRNKIREGNIQQLSTDIQQQQNQLYLQAHKNLKV
jgi:twitching motility protein PilT